MAFCRSCEHEGDAGRDLDALDHRETSSITGETRSITD